MSIVTAAIVCVNGLAAATPGSYRFQRKAEPVAGRPCADLDLAGINDEGDLVGTLNCPGGGMFVTVNRHVRLIKLPIRGDRQSQGTALASNGIATGVTVLNNEYWRSWLVYPNGKLVKIADPKAARGLTRVSGVNSHGEAVGGYASDARYQQFTVPFIYEPSPTGGRYRNIHLGIAGVTDVEALSINDRGVICGSFRDETNHEHGFVIRAGEVHVVNVPHAPSGPNNGTALVGIADNGSYAAVTTNVNPPSMEFASYVHSQAGWSTVTPPSSWGYHASITGLNSTGRVVGSFVGATDFEDHSFVGRPIRRRTHSSSPSFALRLTELDASRSGGCDQRVKREIFCRVDSVARESASALMSQVVQRRPSKRSVSGSGASVVSRTRTNVSVPISWVKRSSPSRRKKMLLLWLA